MRFVFCCRFIAVSNYAPEMGICLRGAERDKRFRISAVKMDPLDSGWGAPLW